MQKVKRTIVRYLPPKSKDWPEDRWKEEARWERENVAERPAVVTDQRLIQWGAEPRIETDFEATVSLGSPPLTDEDVDKIVEAGEEAWAIYYPLTSENPVE